MTVSNVQWFACRATDFPHYSGCGQCGCDLITKWTCLAFIYTVAVYNPDLTIEHYGTEKLWQYFYNTVMGFRQLISTYEMKQIIWCTNNLNFHKRLMGSNFLFKECSPYAAHLYDAEDANTPMRVLPGLCGDYCSDYWRDCRYTLSLLLEDKGNPQQFANLTAAIEEDRRSFCDFLEFKDKQYCYPNVLTDAGTS